MSIFIANGIHHGIGVNVVAIVGDSAIIVNQAGTEENFVRLAEITDILIHEDSVEVVRDMVSEFGEEDARRIVATLTQSWAWADMIVAAAKH